MVRAQRDHLSRNQQPIALPELLGSSEGITRLAELLCHSGAFTRTDFTRTGVPREPGPRQPPRILGFDDEPDAVPDRLPTDDDGWWRALGPRRARRCRLERYDIIECEE